MPKLIPWSADSDKVYKWCPHCHHMSEDHDGFGVLFCEECRYCICPSITNAICDSCGKSWRNDVEDED